MKRVTFARRGTETLRRVVKALGEFLVGLSRPSPGG